MDLQFTLLVINTILLVLVGYLLKSYLPTYFAEKAKLLAQREDISAITREIEAVKSEYIEHIKKFEAEQQLAVSFKSALKENRDNTLLEYFDCMVDLIERRLSDGFVLAAFGSFELGTNDKYLDEVQTYFVKARLCYYRIIIMFPHDHSLHVSASKLFELLQKLSDCFRSTYCKLGPYRHLINLYKSSPEKKDDVIEHIEKIQVIVSDYQKEVKSLVTDAHSSVIIYLAELNRHFNGAIRLPDFVSKAFQITKEEPEGSTTDMGHEKERNVPTQGWTGP